MMFCMCLNYGSTFRILLASDDIHVKDHLTFEVPPKKIVERSIKQLRNKQVSLVKVIWNEVTGDATWNLEDKMREQHPELFSDP